MSSAILDRQLDSIEQQFNELSGVLLGGDPLCVEVASGALQQLVVDLLQMADEVGRASFQSNARAARIKALAGMFPLLRGNVLRRSAFVDRALETIIPNAPQNGYASQAKTYGSSMRQSGAFKVLSA